MPTKKDESEWTAHKQSHLEPPALEKFLQERYLVDIILLGGGGSSTENTKAAAEDVEKSPVDMKNWLGDHSWVPGSPLRCAWEIPKVLRGLAKAQGTPSSRHPDKSTIYNFLANYVVLYGKNNSFACSTCKEFLKGTWGSAGSAALRIMVAAILRAMLIQTPDLEPEELLPSYQTGIEGCTAVVFQLRSYGTMKMTEIAQALRWLCAVVRLPYRRSSGKVEEHPVGDQGFVWCAVERKGGSIDSHYRLGPLRPQPLYSRPLELSCWTAFFKKGVIIESPIRRRWGKGLEVSFELMVTLAGVENMYELNGGTILFGFFTALIPVSYDEETHSVQWHLETAKDCINPNQLECTRGDWLRTKDMDRLRTSRCFVGWFEKANVMLGTRQLVTDESRQIRWTQGLKARKRTLHQNGLEFGLQSGWTLGPINTVVQGISTWTFHSNVQRYSASGQYVQALRLRSREVTLVIDAESRRAWLVPLVSWILHLCHRYYIESSCEDDTPIPFADPSTDGASATITAAEAKGDTVVFGSGTSEPETLRQLWLRISTNLQDSRRDGEEPQNGLIFAAEAMDIALSRSSSSLKEIKVSEESRSWTQFAKMVKSVTVCANLGNAIVPIPPSGKLCECCTLLERQDFLAAHTWSLARLLEESGSSVVQLKQGMCSFEKNTTWRVDGGLETLWTKCDAGRACSNIWGDIPSSSSVLQKLERDGAIKNKGKDESGVCSVKCGREHESGVVVFGGGLAPSPTVDVVDALDKLMSRVTFRSLMARQPVAEV